jgi:hypothetical protein
VGTLVGHDDEVLIDPILQGPTVPMEEHFVTGSTRFLLRVVNREETVRGDLILEAAGTAYGESVPENEADLRITNALRVGVSRRLTLDAALVAWRYRRGDGSSFDLDMLRPELRLAWSAGKGWLFTTGARWSWLRFPFRESPEDSVPGDEPGENQEQLDLLAGAIRSVGPGYAGMEFLMRGTQSTFDEAEYAGPVATLRLGLLLRRRWDLSSYAVYGHRTYSTFLPEGEEDLVERQDDTYQLGLTMEWMLRRRFRFLADVALVQQNSTVEDYRYDQARVSFGVSVDLVDTLPRRTFGVETPPRLLAPAPGEGGIRFLHRAPGAGTVSLVGGFNAWDAAQGLMEGPDREGIWSLTVPVPPGRWRYAFVVDGVWVAPQDAPLIEDDGFGGVQGILVVDPAATGL